MNQRLRASKSATDRAADADRQLRRRRLTFPDDVEVIVERGDLVNLGFRKPLFLGESEQSGRAEKAPAVLDEMEEFDEEIAPARSVAKERPNFGERSFV